MALSCQSWLLMGLSLRPHVVDWQVRGKKKSLFRNWGINCPALWWPCPVNHGPNTAGAHLCGGLTLKGPGGGRNPPPLDVSRFSAPRAFMTFFFEVLRNFWRYFRKNRAYHSKVTQHYVIERRLKIWKFSGFVYKTYGKWLLVPKLHFEL